MFKSNSILNFICRFCIINHIFIYLKNVLRDIFVNNNCNEVEFEKNGDEWHSISCMSDSTDQSVPVNFDMYNRVNIILNN